MLIESTPGLANVAIAAFSRQAGTPHERSESTNVQQQTPAERISNSYTDSVEISEDAKSRSETASSATSSENTQLSDEEQQQLRELKARDREVRTHEQAHRSRAGQYVRGATQYKYQRGPDGQFYAVGGEVQIDTSEVPNNPEATIQKLRTIRAAALAPSNPSPADRRVAAEATRKEAQARAELQEERAEQARETNPAPNSSDVEGTDQRTEDSEEGQRPRSSILPFLNNQRIAPPPGDLLNIFA